MQIDVEIPKDVDNSGMKGKLKPGKQQIPKDNTSPSSIKLRPKVYVFGISFATTSRLRFGAMTTNYCETKKSWQTKGALQCYHEGVSLSSQTAAIECSRPKVKPPFIVRRPPIISRLTCDFTLLPRYVSLLMVTSLRAIHVFLPAKNQCGPTVGVPKPISPDKSVRKFGPSKEQDGPH
jgi:hypothetical protein